MKTFKEIATEVVERAEGAATTRRTYSWLLGLTEPLHRERVDRLAPQQVFALLQRIGESRSSSRKVLLFVGRTLRLAAALGYRTEGDFTRDMVKTLKRPVAKKHRAAILDPAALGALQRAIDGLDGSTAIRDALRLAPHVFVRPAELRGMRWSELDLGAHRWTIPAERMKGRRPHVVPLARQVLEILESRRAALPPGVREQWVSPFVFPGRDRRKCISENTLALALGRLMYSREEISPHGFRATASTLLRDALREDGELIELQLAHRVGSATRQAYDRAERLEERAAMMQRWSDYLDSLRVGI